MREHAYSHGDAIAVRYLSWALGWAVILMLVGLLASLQFIWPELWRGIPFLSFGRLRPVHSQGILYGWLSLGMIGGWLYILPRLTRSPLYRPGLARLALTVWNVALCIGMVGVASGYTQGYEYADWIWPADILFVSALFVLSYQMIQSVRHRREPSVYVSLWYMLGTLVWFSGVYLIGNTPLFSGMNQMNVNWFLGHSIVGLWFTTGILAIAYYLFPKVFGQPIWSHKLSLIGFWFIGTFYIQNGPHHLVFSPMMYWLQSWSIVSSIFLFIPVWAVLANFWGSVNGRWGVLSKDISARFLVTGWAFYFLTCLQGPMQALRSVSAVTHFSQWVVGHAHLALLGFATFFLDAAVYYFVPRIAGRALYSMRLGAAHYWLQLTGAFFMVIDLTAGSMIQYTIWRTGLPFIASVIELRPYWAIRAATGVLIVTGQIVLTYNMYRTLRPRLNVRRRRLQAASSQ